MGKKVLKHTVADMFWILFGGEKRRRNCTVTLTLTQIKERHQQKLKRAQETQDAEHSKVGNSGRCSAKHKENKERLAPKLVAIQKKNLLSSATGMVFKNVPHS